MDSGIEYFTEFGILEFTTKELLNLPEEERQFLLAVSLITNDVRFHWSIMSRSKSDGQNDDIKTMQIVRDLWSLRKLAAVIYEAQLALHAFSGKIEFIREMKDAGTLIIKKPKNGDKYLELANKLRNRSASHYDVRDLVKNINGFDSDIIHRYYAHQQQGNSISAICEQIITVPTIRTAFDGANENDFHHWCMSASNSIMQFCGLAIAKLCEIRMPEKHIQLKEVVVGTEARSMEHRWPLFAVVEQANNKSQN
jgi:hypothetical protein